MLKDSKFVLETAMYAPFLINLRLINLFDKDLHKVNITTLVVFFFCKVLLRDQISAETNFPAAFERKYCQAQ